MLFSGGAVPPAGRPAGWDNCRKGHLQMQLRGPAETAAQRVHDRIQHNHQQVEGELPNAHTRGRRWAGAGWQLRPVLWGHHVQVERRKSLNVTADGLFCTKKTFCFPAFPSSVRPPKKSWKKIFNLSGGEKTLSSLALVFALHHYKPTPLYFMDEIDAALDFKNVSIVACYIYVSMNLKHDRKSL